jgi:uncharacterized protein (TIGR02117 family)
MQAASKRTKSTRLMRVLLQTVLSVVAIPVSYLLIAHVSVLIPHAASFPNDSEAATEIYVINNGIHIDLVLPRQHVLKDWDLSFNPPDSIAQKPNLDMLAIGWGDAAFYLETPAWSDLKVSTALRALSGKNQSLLHIQYLAKAQLGNEVPLAISAAQYLALIEHVQSSTAAPSVHALDHPGYGDTDFFYAAKGHYSAIHTCNTWAADGLAKAGLKVPRWAPFPWLVQFYREQW